jgi:hypothetical protein
VKSRDCSDSATRSVPHRAGAARSESGKSGTGKAHIGLGPRGLDDRFHEIDQLQL